MTLDKKKIEILKIEKEMGILVKKFLRLKNLPFPKKINAQVSRVNKMLILSTQARMKEMERQTVISQPYPKHKLGGVSMVTSVSEREDEFIRSANEIIKHYNPEFPKDRNTKNMVIV